MKMMLKDLIGKEIQVWPGDTYSKYGVLIDAEEQGILVKIDGTRSKAADWSDDGKLIFLAYSASLIFKEA